MYKCAHALFNWWAEEALEKYGLADYARFSLTMLISHQDLVVTNQIAESRELRNNGTDRGSVLIRMTSVQNANEDGRRSVCSVFVCTNLVIYFRP